MPVWAVTLIVSFATQLFEFVFKRLDKMPLDKKLEAQAASLPVHMHTELRTVVLPPKPTDEYTGQW